MRILIVAIFAFLMAQSDSFATCQCHCVNGEVEAICTSSIDIKPICASKICPFAPPNIKPIEPLTLPPPGMTSCEMKQVLDTNSNKYQWKRVCK
jgi:hypothetical protein